jgi:autotransporter strand-loop-strand O-heptosyltransferase
MSEKLIDYDFIEIGTSDFDTLIETSKNDIIGLSIEPIKYYLDRLPNKNNVKKLQVAVSDIDGEIDIYYIPDEKIKEHSFPWWVRGSNSIGKPHPFTVKEIGKEIYDSVVKVDKVPTLSWNTLVKQEKINSINFLKIDTEGFDHVILNDYLIMCEKNPKLFANKIKFERHPEVSNIEKIDEIILKFKDYYSEINGTDVILTKVKIPRIIHQTFRTNELPEPIQEVVDKLKSMNPEFEYRFYNDEDCYNFIKENYDEETLNLYSNINPKYGSCKADFFRYLLMYKVGGVYLDIKSRSITPLKNIILPTDEYVLSHWSGRDWADELNYPHGEFQNWHIICIPGHPFLRETIERVKKNLRNYDGGVGKLTVLRLTGPIPYSEAILSLLDKHKTNYIDSPVREFKTELEINLLYRGTFLHQDKLYGFNVSNEEPILLNHKEFRKSYVLYSTQNYFDIVRMACKSLRTFSDLPIFVYLLDSDSKIDIENVTTINWKSNFKGVDDTNKTSLSNYYIDRGSKKIYELLIQRPLIVKHALQNHSDVVAYVDSDSIATQYCDRIFDMYNPKLEYPYFVEGIYDYLHINGRGGAESRDDLSTTLEHPACELFGVNQYVREKYRQTGYFVAGPNTIDFLDEWYWMCSHPKVLRDFQLYAPYHEETIANVLLWKYNHLDGLPYIYMNGDNQRIDKVFKEDLFVGETKHIGPWFRIPATEKDLFFVHGEKRGFILEEMIERLKIRASGLRNNYDIDPTKNWGDVLSQFLLEHFSGKKLNKDDVFYFDDAAYMLDKNGKIVGIGSSMKYVRPDDYVWGTGCIDEYNIGNKPKKVYSVRGPLTRDILLERGWDVPEIYGDPALLFPTIYNPDVEKKYKFGLIPHCVDFFSLDGLKSINHMEDMGIKIINVTAGVYEFIDQIKECEIILSSSLHGLIAADAYGIPNHRVKLSKLILGGDFKYLDHYASVKREHYEPLQLTDSTTIHEIESLKFETGDISLVNKLLENTPWNDPDCVYIQNAPENKIKVLFLAPHLSTGGMPGFLLRRLELIQNHCPEIEPFVVEYGFYGNAYVVQRNKIIEILPTNHFWSLGDDKMNLINILKDNQIDIVHVDEMLEGFDSFNQVSKELLSELYSDKRTWRIVETCHNVWFDPNIHKLYHPDAYAFCTPYHKEKTFLDVPSYSEVLEFPIEKIFRTDEEQLESQKELNLDPNKVHVINVGLWTSGKNQKEGVEIARLLEKSNPEIQFHFIGNQAPNFQEYWEPIMKILPSNVKVWGERSDISTFMKASDVFMFNSTWECNPLVLREASSYGLKILARNLPQYMDMFTPYITPINEDINKTKELLLSLIEKKRTYDVVEGQSKKFALDHLKFYELVNSKPPKQKTKVKTKVNIIQYFVNQPFLEIRGNSDSTFQVEFFDENGICHYRNNLGANNWCKLNREYFTKWNTKVWEDNTLIYENNLSYKGERVFISFDSSSLGDTIAWIPYVLEFKKKHDCHVIVSTHKNFLFEKVYPELEFVPPGSTVNNIHGMYTIGWFYNENKEPELPNTIPLQKAATNILGLDFKEIKPRISYNIGQRPYEQKYVTIATNSTSGCKFWTKEGWQELINYLHNLGFKIINVSKEKNLFKNAQQISNTSMENTMNVIHHSEFFIGLSSGLSWLAWGMGKHVVMISNFTEPDHEFISDCTRVINLSVCNGCWNSSMFKFDKGDWDWCPVHKGTNRQFECHKSITSKMVIEQIKHLL